MILELEKHVSILPSLHEIRGWPGLWGLAGIWRGGRGAVAYVKLGPGLKEWLPCVLVSGAFVVFPLIQWSCSR